MQKVLLFFCGFIRHKIILIMKGKQPSRPSKVDYYNNRGEQSIASINYGSPQYHNDFSPSRSLGMSSNEDANLAYKMQRQQMKKAKKNDLDHLYKQNYQPAKFNKAVQYRNSRSYMKKLLSGHYKQLDTYEDTEELKNFGLGTYFYVEFFRRLMWLYFVMVLVQGITIYINWKGTGMSSYSANFSTYLVQTTLGNYSGNVLTAYDGFIVTIAPAVNYLAMLLFYFIWKGHYFKTISDQEDDNADVKPEKFCVQVVGLEESYVNEDELKTFFSSFGPVYEVSVIRRYKNKLSYFQQLDELEQAIREEQLQVVLGGGDKSDLNSLKRQKQKLQKFVNTLKIYPKTIQAFVHFQYQKSKIDCMTYFNDHYLFDTCGHDCMRSVCCCCVDEPQQKYLFRGQKLQLKNQKVPTPEDINWGSFQLSPCSKFFRVLFSALIIIIFLALSCAVIGLCSIYINTHSGNCDGVTIPTTAAAASSSNNQTVLQCYCFSNLVASFSDPAVSSVCTNYRNGILISQGIQYGVIATSAITNFIFGFIVDKLVNCVRPISKSSGLLTKTTIYTIFLILNSVFIPVLIYADIFGFQPSNYVSFLTIISGDLKSILSVQNLSFLPDFNKSWYFTVSPVFVNFVIIDTVLTWIFLIVDKCSSSYSGLQDDQGKILQKHMNHKITSYKLNVYKQAATMYLIIFMTAFFWAGVPVLVPLGFINIFSRYTVNRILLQGNSTKIQGLGQEFMSLSITILPLMLIAFPLFGQWMLIANSSIYPNALPMTFPYFSGLYWMLDKQLYLPFYIILSLIAMIEFFFYNTLVRFFSWLSSLCYEKKQVMRPQHTRPFVQYTKGMNILYSFNIRNNDEKRNVMLNIEKYLVDKELE